MKQTPLTRFDRCGVLHFDSIQWAFENHVKEHDHGSFKFAILHGNEDSPDKIEFWRSANPKHDKAPDFVWEREKVVA